MRTPATKGESVSSPARCNSFPAHHLKPSHINKFRCNPAEALINQGANPCTTLDLAPLFHRLRPSKPMELFNQFCHWYGAGMIGITVIVAAGLIYSRFGGK